jgi:hypothetical protein
MTEMTAARRARRDARRDARRRDVRRDEGGFHEPQRLTRATVSRARRNVCSARGRPEVRVGSVLGGPGGVRVGDIVRAIGGVRGWPPNVPIKAGKLSELLKVRECNVRDWNVREWNVREWVVS